MKTRKAETSEKKIKDFVKLFDGTLNNWKMSGKGKFAVVFEKGDEEKLHPCLKTQGGMGLLWYHKKKFKDFILMLEWKVTNIQNNSGIFVRFPDPQDDPWIAVNNGYEIQIDDIGVPDGKSIHMTGAIYGFRRPSKLATRPKGCWNLLYVSVKGQTYSVTINDKVVIENFYGNRSEEGYIGLQNHDDGSIVFFKNIFIKELT